MTERENLSLSFRSEQCSGSQRADFVALQHKTDMLKQHVRWLINYSVAMVDEVLMQERAE